MLGRRHTRRFCPSGMSTKKAAVVMTQQTSPTTVRHASQVFRDFVCMYKPTMPSSRETTHKADNDGRSSDAQLQGDRKQAHAQINENPNVLNQTTTSYISSLPSRTTPPSALQATCSFAAVTNASLQHSKAHHITATVLILKNLRSASLSTSCNARLPLGEM